MDERTAKLQQDAMTLAELAVAFFTAWLKGEAAIMVGQLEVKAKRN